MLKTVVLLHIIMQTVILFFVVVDEVKKLSIWNEWELFSELEELMSSSDYVICFCIITPMHYKRLSCWSRHNLLQNCQRRDFRCDEQNIKVHKTWPYCESHASTFPLGNSCNLLHPRLCWPDFKGCFTSRSQCLKLEMHSTYATHLPDDCFYRLWAQQTFIWKDLCKINSFY